MLLKTGTEAKGDGEPCLNEIPDTATENVPENIANIRRVPLQMVDTTISSLSAT